MTTTHQPWPEGVIARYLTLGQATVDIRYPTKGQNAYYLVATCTAERCQWWERRSVDALYTDTPEQEAARVEERLPWIQDRAQWHAEKCRAMPRPDAQEARRFEAAVDYVRRQVVQP